MPTALLRHSITETPDIAAAIDDTRALWPTDNRADVLRHLVLRGAEVARQDRAARLAAVDKWSGCMTGAFPPDAAQRLKDEWPE